MKRKTPPGFTLIELLSSLGIIAVLIAISLPVVQHARANAHAQTCLSDQKQVLLAVKMYMRDYDDTFPAAYSGLFTTNGHDHPHATRASGSTWIEAIHPYLGAKPETAFVCPDVDDTGLKGYPYATLGFALNGSLAAAARQSSTQIIYNGNPDVVLRYESLTLLFAEARLGMISLHAPDDRLDVVYGMCATRFRPAITKLPRGALRHNGGANYTFVDGHSHWYKPGVLVGGKHSDGKTPGFGL